MEEENKKEEIIENADSTSEEAKGEEGQENNDDSSQEQDPLKKELEKVKNKDKSGGRSELEKALFKKNQIEARIKELKGESNEEEEESEDDKPVTLGMLKQLNKANAVKSALDMADDIENETERELVRFHIENTINSTGNPNEDLRLARAIVNSVKNSKILEEQDRKGKAKTHSSGSSQPAKEESSPNDLTPEELAFMKPPFNLTKDAIIKARQPK